MLACAVYACTHMIRAEDTWIAMASGRHIVNHGVDTTDMFSANSRKAGPTVEEIKTWPIWAQSLVERVGIEKVLYWHPTGWINQNWLANVFIYKLTTVFGSEEEPQLNSLVYWKFILYILTIFCLYAIGRIIGINPALSAMGACLALFVSRSFLAMRPADFSNFFVPVFILILTLAAYWRIWIIWLIVPLTVLWSNVHGGYIYVFIMLVPFVLFSILGLCFQRFFKVISRRGVYYTVGAGLTALIATILFNPFHLTNLTHVSVISLGKNAEHWRMIKEWQPAFEWSNQFGTAVPFLILCLLAGTTVLTWFAVQKYSSVSMVKTGSKTEDYQWPKIPLPMLIIGFLTIYMAIRSRRFIPIAAYTICPFLTLLIQHIAKSLPFPSFKAGKYIQGIFAGLLLVFISWLGIKFYSVYAAPWPFDTQNNSLFMRMTSSYEEPLLVSEFMNLNSIQGNVINFWTEGGGLVWGQKVLMETGKPNVQLFIDGRAQAAYDRYYYDLWKEIWIGGDWGRELSRSAKTPDIADYRKMSIWVNKTLKREKVGLALIPANQFDSHLYWALTHSQTWRVVFASNTHKLFADLDTEQGKRLFLGIRTGQTLYPDDFTRNLNQGHFHLVYNLIPGSRVKGLNLVIKAHFNKPSILPMIEITKIATIYPRLIPEIVRFCEAIFEDFQIYGLMYAKQDGYALRLGAMAMLCEYLQNNSAVQNDTQTASMYADKSDAYSKELDTMLQTKTW